jgi:hypothetical protein
VGVRADGWSRISALSGEDSGASDEPHADAAVLATGLPQAVAGGPPMTQSSWVCCFDAAHIN